MTITRRQALATGAGLIGAGLAPARTLAQGAPASLAFGPKTAVYALGLIAEAKGLFKSEGLDFKLVIGNAGAVSLVVNGRDLGEPGSGGEVVKVNFGPGDPTTTAG